MSIISIFSTLFRLILWQPLFNLLMVFYLYLGHDFGVAIICLTALISLCLFPVQKKAFKSQIALQQIQPKLKEIQIKHKNNREKQAQAFLELYKSQKVNPFSGIFLLFLQLPILFALYRVFMKGLHQADLSNLYSFIPHPAVINPTFFGLLNLNHPSLILAIFVGLVSALQFKISSNLSLKKEKETRSKSIQGQMSYIFAAFLVFLFARFPSALSLYLVVSGIFTIIQQYFVRKEYLATLKK